MYSAANIGIDAWAVDFLLLNTDGKRISDAVPTAMSAPRVYGKLLEKSTA